MLIQGERIFICGLLILPGLFCVGHFFCLCVIPPPTVLLWKVKILKKGQIFCLAGFAWRANTLNCVGFFLSLWWSRSGAFFIRVHLRTSIIFFRATNSTARFGIFFFGVV